jgi:hypothetical protein
MQLLSLAANETLRLDNSVSRNRALADIASRAISGLQVGEFEERILALEVVAERHKDAHGEGLQGGQHGKTRRSRIPAKRRSIEVRVGRLEANRIEEYAAFGARVSAVVIGVLDRHVQDATMRREIRSEIARDILSLNQTDPVEPEKGSGKHVGE